MPIVDMELWLRQRLIECFDNSLLTQSFINEKKEILNGKVYKYCPIIDDIIDDNGNIAPQKQYAIENIENSVIYMSRISNFNDPFDTYMSFSVTALIGEIVTDIVKKQNDTPGLVAVMPTLVDGLLNDADANEKKHLEYLSNLIIKIPQLFSTKGTKQIDSSTLQNLLLSDYISGNKAAIEFCEYISKNPYTLTTILKAIVFAIKENPKLLIENPEIELSDEVKENIRKFFINSTIEDENASGLQKQIQEFKEELRKNEREISKAIVKAHDILDKEFYVTCFTASPNNALMWAHYANKHKGFCVEYDLTCTESSTFLVNLHPVLYSQKRPSVPSSLFDFSDLKNIKISTSNLSISDLILALLKKSDVWQYEEEWRLLLYDKAGKELIENKLHIDCMNKIILGCNMETKFEDILTDICKKKGLHLSKMILDEKDYKLTEQLIF